MTEKIKVRRSENIDYDNVIDMTPINEWLSGLGGDRRTPEEFLKHHPEFLPIKDTLYKRYRRQVEKYPTFYAMRDWIVRNDPNIIEDWGYHVHDKILPKQEKLHKELTETGFFKKGLKLNVYTGEVK